MNFASAVARPIRNRRIDTSAPLVSIVVPMYNVEDYVSGTLASIVDQSHGNLEIICVDDGSPDASAAIARQWARFDRRIRVISQENKGLGGARNTGAAHATGKYLTFADSDDTLLPNAINAMVTSLESSGSDFAVGAMARRQGKRIWTPRWVRQVHYRDRIGVTLAEAPDVLPEAFAWNKVWRRDFFNEAVREFPTGILYEDQEPSFASFLNAKSFDILAETVYLWEIRADGSSLSQQKSRMKDLEDRLTVTRRMAESLPDDVPRSVRDAFYAKAFEIDLCQYMEQVPRVGAEYFRTLCDGIEELVAMSGGEFWNKLPIYQRLLTRFASTHDYDSMMKVIAGKLEEGVGGWLQESVNGRLLEKPSYLSEVTNPPNEDFFAIEPEQLEVNGTVTGIEWVDEQRVRVSCVAIALSEFLGDKGQSATFSLENSLTGETLPLESERYSDPYFVDAVRSSTVDPSHSAYVIDIDTSKLRFVDKEDWKLTAHIKVGRHVVSGSIHGLHSDRAAAVRGFAEWDGDKKIVLSHSRHAGLVFRLASPQCIVRNVVLEDRRLSFTVRVLNGKRVAALEMENSRTRQRIRVQPRGFDRHGDAEYVVDVPDLPTRNQVPSDQRWQVKVRFVDRRSARLLLAESRFDFDRRSRECSSLSLDCDSYGYLRLSELPCRIVCSSISANDREGTLTFSGEAFLPAGAIPGDAVLAASTHELVAQSTQWDDDHKRFTAVFALTDIDWYGRRVSIAHGKYSLRFRMTVPHDPEASHSQGAVIRDRDVQTLPWRGHTATARLTVTRTVRAKAVWLTVANPLRQDEIGVFNQARLKRAAIDRADQDGLTDTMVFESYHGKQIADSPRAIFERLVETVSAPELVWSVNSTAVSVPSGARSVLRGSTEWFDSVFSAKYLVNNSNFPPYFRKHPGQAYLQTWHGTPLKRIAEDMPPANLSLGYRVTMRREADMWDLMLAQNDFAAKVLPNAFRYLGETLNVGYPRNDILVRPDAEERAGEARERLGILEGERVLLYAPTFRDSKKSGGVYDFDLNIDLQELNRCLPAHTRVLLRGHSNTGGVSDLELPENVLDVSSYGEISELFLISDVLVTDYSSMMFDFAVTQKPMLFYVPDLEEYENSTRGFYMRLSEIWPGALYRTPDELFVGLSQAFSDPTSFRSEAYEAFLHKFAPNDDGCASRRVIDEMRRRGWF